MNCNKRTKHSFFAVHRAIGQWPTNILHFWFNVREQQERRSFRKNHSYINNNLQRIYEYEYIRGKRIFFSLLLLVEERLAYMCYQINLNWCAPPCLVSSFGCTVPCNASCHAIPCHDPKCVCVFWSE